MKRIKYRVFEFKSGSIEGIIEIDSATTDEGMRIAKRLLPKANRKNVSIREVLYAN